MQSAMQITKLNYDFNIEYSQDVFDEFLSRLMYSKIIPIDEQCEYALTNKEGQTMFTVLLMTKEFNDLLEYCKGVEEQMKEILTHRFIVGVLNEDPIFWL